MSLLSIDIELAFKTIQRQAPCQHDSADTRIGDGKTWAKCPDCHLVIAQKRIPDAKARAAAFDDAVACLRDRISQLEGQS